MKTGDIVGQHYEVQSLLGEGSMGVVYKGWDRSLDRPVAIKVLKPDVGSGTERFRREAQILANLNHGNICQVYSLVQHDGRDVMVLQYLDGTSLDEVLKRQGPLPWDEVKQVATDVLAGLTEAHHAKVVHRDLKPANLMRVATATRMKTVIMDFGIARAQGRARATREGMVACTIEYASPEQIQGEDVGPASDLYSLGMVLYELLMGELAFAANTDAAWAHAHVYEAPDWGKVEALHGKAMARFLEQATQKAVASRYACAQQMAQSLQALAVQLDSGGAKAFFKRRGATIGRMDDQTPDRIAAQVAGRAEGAVTGVRATPKQSRGSESGMPTVLQHWTYVFLVLMLLLGGSFFVAGMGGTGSNDNTQPSASAPAAGAAEAAPVAIRPLSPPVSNAPSAEPSSANGAAGTRSNAAASPAVVPTHTLDMGTPHRPAAPPANPAPRPIANAPASFSCDSLNWGLRIACKVDGPAIIQKCAPDLRNWNHNLPGCDRRSNNNIAN